MKWLLGLLLFAVVVLVAVSFGKPYYRYYSLGYDTKDFLEMETRNVSAIREKIVARAAELQVPLDESDLQITVEDKKVRVKAVWSDRVDFFGFYQKQLDFVMEKEY